MPIKALALLALVLAPLAGAQTAYRLLQADYQGRQIGSKHYSADGVRCLSIAACNACLQNFQLDHLEPDVLAAVCDAAMGKCQALQSSDGAASQ
jgi:hypothetical protein